MDSTSLSCVLEALSLFPLPFSLSRRRLAILHNTLSDKWLLRAVNFWLSQEHNGKAHRRQTNEMACLGRCVFETSNQALPMTLTALAKALQKATMVHRRASLRMFSGFGAAPRLRQHLSDLRTTQFSDFKPLDFLTKPLRDIPHV